MQIPDRDTLNKLAGTLFNLLLLRAGPQDLPSSWPLTATISIVYLGQGILTSQHLGGEDSAARTIVAIVIQFSAVAALLKFRRRPQRLEQTLLAIAGTGIMLGLLAFMFLVQADPDAQQPLLALIWFGIFGWSLAVDANIYRHALSISRAQGVLIAVLLLAATYMAIEAMF